MYLIQTSKKSFLDLVLNRQIPNAENIQKWGIFVPVQHEVRKDYTLQCKNCPKEFSNQKSYLEHMGDEHILFESQDMSTPEPEAGKS